MKKVFMLGLVAFFALTGAVGAHPPSEIKLTYDLITQVLKIEVAHVTKNALKDRIRLIAVTKNAEEPIKLFFPSQETQGITTEVTVAATIGDTISVKAYSSQGGSSEQSLKVQ